MAKYGPGKVGGESVKGYREEDRVDPDSGTETYAALKLQIENWRWAGVPFYIRAGKRLAKRTTEISIQFKLPPQLLFKDMSQGACAELQPNVITMRIQPDEGISLRFSSKVPSPNMEVCPVIMDFNYADAFGKSSANGYERLAAGRDARRRNPVCSSRWRGGDLVAADARSSRIGQPTKPKDFPNYAAGTWGPKAADELLAREGHAWRKL